MTCFNSISRGTSLHILCFYHLPDCQRCIVMKLGVTSAITMFQSSTLLQSSHLITIVFPTGTVFPLLLKPLKLQQHLSQVLY